MKNFMLKMLLNKAGDGDGGGGAPKDPPDGQQPPPKKDDPPPPKDGNPDDEFDELGYKKAAPPKVPGDKKPEGDKSKEDPPAEPKKVENPATGYGDEPPKVDDPPPAEPPKDPPPPPSELEKKLEGLGKTFAEDVKKQVSELGLEGEKLDKFIAFRKQEYKDAQEWGQRQQAEAQRQQQVQRQQWHKELKEDPAFGGDKFLANVARSEKVLDEYLPELKKELTEAKQVLRPSVMRGLARLADQLYPDRKLVQGDPPAPEEKPDDNKPNDPLAFYQ